MKECLLVLVAAAVMLAACPAMRQMDTFVELCLQHRMETEKQEDDTE